MLHHEIPFLGGDGLGLYGQGWLPEAAAAVVIVVPGLAEHGGRHASTAEVLVEHGYAVYAMDLRGHGRSGGPRCFVDSFDRYLEDLDRWFDVVGRREPGKPLFVLGHSMGGLIAALWSLSRRPPGDCPDFRGHHRAPTRSVGRHGRENGTVPFGPPVRGLVLSASALRLHDRVFPVLRHLAGLVGRWLPRLRLVQVSFQSLSRDPAVVAEFQADPLVFHGRFPVRTGAEILRAMRRLEAAAGSLQLPLLVLQGTADRLCDPDGSREFYRLAGSADKTLRLYDGLYHDIFHEPEHEQVLADLVAWLDARR